MIQGIAVVDTSITASRFSPKSKPQKIAPVRKEDQHQEPKFQAEESDDEEQ